MMGTLSGSRGLPDGLPVLRGWARLLFMILWCVSLAATVAGGIATLAPLFGPPEIGVRSLVGIRLQEDLPPGTLGAPIGDEATHAGIRPGDRLLLVDGRPAALDSAGLDRQLEGPAAGAVTLTTIDASGHIARHRLTRSPVHFRQALAQLGLGVASANLLEKGPAILFALLLPIICGVLLLVRRPRDALAPWASLMMLMLTLGDSPAGRWVANWSPQPVLLADAFNVAGFALLVAVLSFFPEGRLRPRWSIATALIGQCW